MCKEEYSTINFPIAENVQLEMVIILGYKGELKNTTDEKMAEIRQDFMLGKYPVTQEQFEAVMGFNPSVFKGAKRPVENVTWDEAKEFCEKLNKRILLLYDRKFNLPTQFQWNYVAHSRGTVPFEDEDEFGKFAWFEKNAGGETHEVGRRSRTRSGCMTCTAMSTNGATPSGRTQASLVTPCPRRATLCVSHQEATGRTTPTPVSRASI